MESQCHIFSFNVILVGKFDLYSFVCLLLVGICLSQDWIYYPVGKDTLARNE
jgi:hypothetical protein